MYRAPIKDQFLREYYTTETTRTNARAVLERLAPYEEKLEADFSTIRGDALRDIVSSVVGARPASAASGLSVLRAYARWCVANHMPGACDDVQKIKTPGIDKYRSQSVADPAHLQIYLNQVFCPESEDTIDVAYRCFLWFAFSGIKENDAPKVRSCHVDFDMMRICLDDGSTYPIYGEALPALRRAVLLTEFVCHNPIYTDNKVARKERVSGDFVLRGIKKGDNDVEPDIGRMRTMTSKKTKAALDDGRTLQRLSYKRLYSCGIFYRAYQAERIGAPVRFYHQAQIDSKASNKSSITRMAKWYESDYEFWKLAFHM